jgi:putative membrane protein
MLWLKSFHIIAMVAWFAGLFYLPRLFVYHADIPASDQTGYQRFCTMERRLFWGIMTPSAIITLLLGIGLVHSFKLSFSAPPLWLNLKLGLVAALILYHIYCAMVVAKFKHQKNNHSALFYRWFNEMPALALIAIVLLVVIKPT